MKRTLKLVARPAKGATQRGVVVWVETWWLFGVIPVYQQERAASA